MRSALLLGCAFAAVGSGVAWADTATETATAQAPSSALEEVVVTARRTAENLQKTPVAVTSIKQEVFQRAGVFETTRFNQVAPGLHVTATVSDRNNVTFNIRGQGYTYGTTFPAVIPYFAETPVIALFSNGNLFDLDNVQVLRGPQGVQFGRVTDGGNVLVEPKHPTNTLGGFVEGQVGNYGMYGVTGALNLPIVPDKVMIRVAGQMQKRDGFTTNVFNGQKLDDVNYYTWRIGVLLRPTEKLENYLVIQDSLSNDHGTSTKLSLVNPAAVTATVTPLFTGFGPLYTGLLGPGVPLTPANLVAALQTELARQTALGPRQTYLNGPVRDQRHNLYVVDKTNYNLNDNISIHNILGYQRATDREGSDFDGSTLAYIDTYHPFLPFFSQEQLSEEFQVHGKALNSRLSYTAGAYFDYQHPGELNENYTVNLEILQRDNVANQATRSTAGYVQAEYDFSDVLHGFKINGGYRRTHDTFVSHYVTYLAQVPFPTLPGFLQPPPIPHGVCTSYRAALGPETCTNARQETDVNTYSFGASEQLTPTQFGYIKYSRGYRPGGINQSPPSAALATYHPEFDYSLELGWKSDWSFGDVKARTNIALFSDVYANIQKLNTVVTGGGAPASITVNFPKAHVQGVEFEGTLIPVNGLTLSMQWAYIDAKFKNTAGAPNSVLFGDAAPFILAGITPPAAEGACNRNAFVELGFCYLNRFNGTPLNTLSFDAHYTLPLDPSIGPVTIGGNLYHQSSMALNDTNMLNPDAVQKAYTLLNLDASWEHVMGSPVTLGFFMTNVTNQLYLVGDNSLSHNASVGTSANIWAPPRMFGFSMRYTFGGG